VHDQNQEKDVCEHCDFRLLPWRKWDIHCSGWLHIIYK